jgi:TrmH family RNA methyltransferase
MSMQSISKNQKKLINSLKYKKYRHKNGLFVVEGIKVIKEFLKSSYKLHSLYSVADIFSLKENPVHIISPEDLKSISFLTTPQVALALFKIKEKNNIQLKSFTLALDGVRDPGNLGTIIRMCDWFGIKKIICSMDSVDCYNPKSVQASMGSLSRVKIYYVDLHKALKQTILPVYGADMHGHSIYDINVPQNSILVLGNESHGISDEVSSVISQNLSIPQFGKSKQTESLNVAMAGSIIISEIKRKSIET